MTLQSKLDKSLIPKGFYCYETLSVEREVGGTYITTRRCPYFEYKIVDDGLDWREGYCNFIQESDVLLDDLCKVCSENTYSDDEIESMCKPHSNP